ncbi:cysteine hydrolase [Xaviernesmea oryzae]|uniref:Cysteine hydrolase n=1 Tax=Xaviernesmea oryzae TaxID=464029 RepID=A0A1Q9ASN8_9HYPH|nr:cysteine hydrolase [Xaviernesmea oryzae]OLP58325.1 cysteine hydrolase [Xaviernesmea oryzae]SEL41812.1 Nicotinamidase-related amidase [Xaviernesmea oryzae]
MGDDIGSGTHREVWRHLCVDMQRLFFEETPWRVEWMARILPQVVELAERHAERSIFTRFITPERAEDMPGAWADYYRKWPMMTRAELPRDMLDLIPALRRFVPPARLFDKPVYSPWIDGRLHATLQAERVSRLVITGGETDVCVMAAVLGAIDLGYRITLIKDALCSGADTTHDDSLELFGSRFSVQVEILTAEAFLSRAG